MPDQYLGQVSATWRYPVKSLRGEPQTALQLADRGVEGDRVFAVYGSDGQIGSGKSTRRFRRMEGLFDCSARTDPRSGEVLVRTPLGGEQHATSSATAAALSTLLREPVAIRAEDAVPHMDAAPVHLISTASLHWLSGRLGYTHVEPARFRPNFVVDTLATSESERPEENWIGMRLTIGDAQLEITQRAERCVMVNLSQPGVAADEQILRILAHENHACFGVYARVVRTGTIRVGDTLISNVSPAPGN